MIPIDFPEGETTMNLPLNSGQKVECKLYGAPADQVKGVAVICHPHSLMGGSMDNKVVHTLWRAFKELGLNVLRFNFRGVGASEGSYDEGKGEADDLAEILDGLAEKFPSQPLYLAGFSFGAFVAASYAARQQRQPLKRVFLIAPPVHHFAMEALHDLRAPVSIIVGERDELVPVDEVVLWAHSLHDYPLSRVHVLPEASHFFHGCLPALKEKILLEMAL